VRPEDTAMAGGDSQEIAPEPSDELIAENMDGWLAVWSLENCTPEDIYEAGFRHGYEAGHKEAIK
jgi:hypothetical protein